MILGFKPRFKGQIINGQKIHTIREDKNNRWVPGMVIHFATGVRTKDYQQFWYGHCQGIQRISITNARIDHELTHTVYVNDRLLSVAEVGELAKNDGFDNIDEFLEWFMKDGDIIFLGKIIHWTGKRY